MGMRGSHRGELGSVEANLGAGFLGLGVIPGVACVAAAQLLGRDAAVVRLPAGSGWSVQALLDQQASLDT